MASTALTLIQRTRRYLRDWADADTLTASLTDTTGTTVTVADTTIYAKRWPIEVDQELMMIRAMPTGTTLTVERGAQGSTAATHANGAPILVRPDFFAVEILDALNEALDASYPLIYRPVDVEFSGILDSVYEYALPNMSGINVPIPYVNRVEIKIGGDLTYRKLRRYEILRGATPILKFKSAQPAGSTIRISGYGPFTHLAAVTDTLDSFWPVQCEYILPIYAAGSLLMSGEARRVRVDTGAVDAREQATRVGASAAIGGQLLNRFRVELNGSAMPPLPPKQRVVI